MSTRQSKDKIIILKILEYIKEIKEFIKGYTKEKFNKDKKTINACVFNLSQIGELVVRISDELKQENPNIEWRGLKALRNRIVHDYEGVNLNMIWDIFVNELDQIEEDMQNLI